MKGNQELAEGIYPTVKAIFTFLIVARLILFLAAFKFWKLAKMSYYLEIAILMVETFLPLEEEMFGALVFVLLN